MPIQIDHPPWRQQTLNPIGRGISGLGDTLKDVYDVGISEEERRKRDLRLASADKIAAEDRQLLKDQRASEAAASADLRERMANANKILRDNLALNPNMSPTEAGMLRTKIAAENSLLGIKEGDLFAGNIPRDYSGELEFKNKRLGEEVDWREKDRQMRLEIAKLNADSRERVGRMNNATRKALMNRVDNKESFSDVSTDDLLDYYNAAQPVADQGIMTPTGKTFTPLASTTGRKLAGVLEELTLKRGIKLDESGNPISPLVK